MMLRTALSALLSHWRWRPVQLLTLVLGLAMATALWSAVQTINSEARTSYARAAAILGQDRLSKLVREDGAPIDQQVFVTLRKGGWLVSPMLEGARRFADTRVRIIGFDPLSSPPQAQQVNCLNVAVSATSSPVPAFCMQLLIPQPGFTGTSPRCCAKPPIFRRAWC